MMSASSFQNKNNLKVGMVMGCVCPGISLKMINTEGGMKNIALHDTYGRSGNILIKDGFVQHL